MKEWKNGTMTLLESQSTNQPFNLFNPERHTFQTLQTLNSELRTQNSKLFKLFKPFKLETRNTERKTFQTFLISPVILFFMIRHIYKRDLISTVSIYFSRKKEDNYL